MVSRIVPNEGTVGRKRRFGAAGLGNVAVTNLVLQLLLLIPALPSWLCTLISQLINGIAGYFLYGKFVFHATSLRDIRPGARYAICQLALWLLNWGGLILGETIGLPRSLAAILAIPILAITSYTVQKKWIFNPS